MKISLKKITCILLSTLALAAVSACAGDGEDWALVPDDGAESVVPEGEYYTITFTQTGQAPVEKYVKAGETLTDVPTAKPRAGYTVVWEIADFSTVTGDRTVRAVETPNEYVVRYSLGEQTSASITASTQTVVYDTDVTLYTPTCAGYAFVRWELDGEEFKNGKYTVAGDITLVAVWEIDREADRWWSDLA